MSWYWIVLLIFAYTFIGALMFSISCRVEKANEATMVLLGILACIWPITMVCIPLALIVLGVDKLVDKFYKRKESNGNTK